MQRPLAVPSTILLSVVALISGCGIDTESRVTAERTLGTSRSELYIDDSVLWPSSEIEVCWETAGNDTQKEWVRDAVSSTWEAEANVNFVGWNVCTPTSTGIRIRTADERPRTVGLGRSLDGVANGMVLNFWYTFIDIPSGTQPLSWCIGTEESCTRMFAVREFGHALGFQREDYRPDTPANCVSTGGPAVALPVGQWDLQSTMNDCNPVAFNGGRLSPTDIWGVTVAYGARRPISVSLDAGIALSTFETSYQGNPTAYHARVTSDEWGTWARSDFLDVTATGTPSVVRSTGSSVRDDLFIRGDDGALWTRSHVSGGGWTAFAQVHWNPIVGSPLAVFRNDSLLDVYVRGTDGALYVTSRPSNGTWSPYVLLGGSFVGTPAVIARPPNRVDVFMRGSDNRLYTTFWNGSVWSAVTQLGTNKIASNPSVVSMDPSRIDVFVRGTDGRLYTKSLVGGTWTGYVQLGSNSFLGDPAAVSSGPGRIDVFVRGTNSALYTKSRNGAWSNYTQLQPNPIVASPSAVAGSANRLTVFARGTDGAVYMKAWDGMSWSSWAGIP